jgi:plastocyanin
MTGGIRTDPRAAARVLAAALMVVLAHGVGRADSKPETHSIAIRGFQYLPAKLVVQQGDTVVWTNEDIVPHTATAQGKGLDSGSIGTKQSWRYTADRQGTYSYDCTFHPNMKGTLVVR